MSNQDSPEVQKEKNDAIRALSGIRHELLSLSPFIASIAMKFDLIPIRDCRCRTACTDAKSIYFDLAFLKTLRHNEIIFVMAHEIWHNVLLHFARRQNRDIDLFNIAADMEVNHMLKTDFGKKASPPSGLLFPPKELEGKSAETIYAWLEKNTLRKQSKPGGAKSNGLGSGQFDKHLYNDDNISESEYQPARDQWGEVGFDPNFNPGFSPRAADEMRSTVVSAAQRYSREHGDLPSHLNGFIKKLARPQVNWKERLCQFVTKHYGSSHNWCPPNRRHLHSDMYFQSRRSEEIKIGVFIDTSASTSADLPQFFGELKGLVESFSGYTIHCIHCDAAVDKYELYDDSNPFNVEDAAGIKYFGGGGTSLNPPFKYVFDNQINLDCAIYMTDGYADPPNVDIPKYPVLWLVTENGNSSALKRFGEVTFFKQSQF